MLGQALCALKVQIAAARAFVLGHLLLADAALHLPGQPVCAPEQLVPAALQSRARLLVLLLLHACFEPAKGHSLGFDVPDFVKAEIKCFCSVWG